MNAKEFLRKKLGELYSKFENIKIQYEYQIGTAIHVVEILPLDVFESNSYIDEEIALDEEFEQSYPNEEVLFISSDSLTQIKEAEYQWGYNLNDTKLFESELEELSFNLDKTIGLDYTPEYYNYALAA